MKDNLYSPLRILYKIPIGKIIRTTLSCLGLPLRPNTVFIRTHPLRIHPFCHIDFCQIGSDDGDAVVIVTMLMTLDDLTSVTVGLKLED